jgi:hypothetical protein
MIEKTTVDGRPVIVAYLNDEFEPVDDRDASLVKVTFTDEEGGVAFLVPASSGTVSDFNPYHVEAGEAGGQFTTGAGISGPRSQELETLKTLPEVRMMGGVMPEFAAHVDRLLVEINKRHPGLIARANLKDVEVSFDAEEYKGSNTYTIPQGTNALYDYGVKPPRLAVFDKTFSDYEEREPGIGTYILIHELGHAYDRSHGLISSKPDFQEAMAADHREWETSKEGKEEYIFLFKQQREVFADTVAHILSRPLLGGEERKKHHYLIGHERFASVFPRTIAYMRKRMRQDGII